MNDERARRQQPGARITSILVDSLAALSLRVLRFDRAADKVLSEYFRINAKLGQADRGFLAETVYAGLRRKRLVDFLLDAAGPLREGKQTAFDHARAFSLATLVRVRGMNLRELEAALSREELAWLHRLKAVARDDMPFEVQCDLPDWVIARLRGHLSDEALRELAQSLQHPAPLDLRVNLLESDRDAVLRALRDEGIDAQASPYAPTGVRLSTKPALQRHPLFLSGAIEVQDEGSQLLACLVAPRRGEMIADFCAGAGGKTLAMAALMRSRGRIYAYDISEKRLARLKPRLARSGASNVDTRHIESERDPKLGRLAGKLDRVLVDAPCSGLGTARRNPDLKWRQSEAALAELTLKQTAILHAAARLVKVGGRLVYATCSFLPEENEAIVRQFLDKNPAFRALDAATVLAAQQIDLPQSDRGDEFLRLSPAVHGTDCFFAAVLERVAA